MNTKALLTAPLAACLFGMSVAVLAVTPGTDATSVRAESGATPTEAQDERSPQMGQMKRGGMHERGMMGGGMMHGGMTHGGMMDGGMMSMMGGCPMMSAANGSNEKVMMQMHGEMMRAMGDIMMKYADKLEAPAPSD
jgi:hypothetical protein